MTVQYSDYTVEQLRAELGKLKEKAQTAEQLGEISKVAIYERQSQIVASYMINPTDFSADTIYTLRNDPGHTFHIHYINGIMAWGKRINLLGESFEKVEALPISLLGEEVTK